MTNKILTQRLVYAPLIVSCLLFQTPLRGSVTYAESIEHIQAANPPKTSITDTARQAGSDKVRVFNNALLDKLFANDRLALKGGGNKEDAAVVNQNDGRKPLPQVSPPVVPPALLLPNDSIAAKITSRTPSNLAAALRFAERGRKEIKLREYQKAVNYFERAVSLGLRSYLPYIYYYLAQTHYHLANYQNAVNFLEVAESWLGDYSDWMTSIATLREDNTNAMGYAQAPTASRIR